VQMIAVWHCVKWRISDQFRLI